MQTAHPLRDEWSLRRPSGGGRRETYGVTYLKKTVGPPSLKTLIQARHDRPSSSGGPLEATSALLTGAGSIHTIQRLLPMRSASPVARHPDPLTMRGAYDMKRGEVLPRALGPESWPLGSALHAPD